MSTGWCSATTAWERTDTWAPISPERPVLLLRHNRNVTIRGNTYDGKEKFTQTIQ